VDKINLRSALGTFSGKRIFITGHTGFKGSWLTFALTEIGAAVKGFSLPEAPSGRLFDLLETRAKIEHAEGDVRDAASLRAAMDSFQPEFVFHLAAQALVKRSYREPVLTFETNVLGSANLLEAVRQCDSVRSLVYITSDKCYENVEWVWGYRENDRMGGHDPYSASKAAAEIVFNAYARSYFSGRPKLGAATARAGNVIGGGDWAADRIVPDCIRALNAGKPILLRNPLSTRPWQHVLEPISGYLLLAAALRANPAAYAGSWNFGPPMMGTHTVESVANAIISHFGRGRVEVAAGSIQPPEANLLQLNCDKAHQLLGWRANWGFDETVAATAHWYREIGKGADPTETTRAQFKDYFKDSL